MSRRTRSNPDWSDAIAHKNCDAIQQACRDFKLPTPMLDSQCEIDGELGFGSYGAVYSTDDPHYVFKITSDPTEAHFVALSIAMKLKDGIDPKGVTEYLAIFALPSKRDGAPTFAIWRESAKSIGLFVKDSSSCEIREFDDQLARYYDHAEKAFWIADDAAQGMDVESYWAWLKSVTDAANAILDGKAKDIPILTPAFSRALAKAYAVAEEMENNTKSFYVGNALKLWMKTGIAICDMHIKNVGTVERGRCGGSIWAITDAGHTLTLKRKLSQIEIPMIGVERA